MIKLYCYSTIILFLDFKIIMEQFEDQYTSELQKTIPYKTIQDELLDEERINGFIADAMKREKTQVCIFRIQEISALNKYQDIIDNHKNNCLMYQLKEKYKPPFIVYGKNAYYGKNPKNEYYEVYISWPKEQKTCVIS